MWVQSGDWGRGHAMQRQAPSGDRRSGSRPRACGAFRPQPYIPGHNTANDQHLLSLPVPNELPVALIAI